MKWNVEKNNFWCIYLKKFLEKKIKFREIFFNFFFFNYITASHALKNSNNFFDDSFSPSKDTSREISPHIQ